MAPHARYRTASTEPLALAALGQLGALTIATQTGAGSTFRSAPFMLGGHGDELRQTSLRFVAGAASSRFRATLGFCG